MRWVPTVIGRALAAAAALWSMSCDGGTEPELGTLEIVITTSGGDPDLDGYRLIVDGGAPTAAGPVGLFTTITLVDLPTGPHTVVLEGYDTNCDLSRAPLQPVTVTANTTTRAEFEVLCYPTGIMVMARTTGLDYDSNGYAVRIGTHPPERVGATGSLIRGRLTPGAYTVEVSDLAENCRHEGEASRTVEVSFRTLTSVTFSFVCVATTGIVEVSATTSGEDHDPDGYVAQLGSSPTVSFMPLTPVARFHQVPAGTHSAALSGLAPNCRVVDQNPKSIQVTAGGLIRDTVRTSFEVSCLRTEKIAFERDLGIYVAYSDGSHPIQIATGREGPSWSPDGTELVFHGVECSWYYYYDQSCLDAGLFVVGVDGAGFRELTDVQSDRNPAWSPDGSRVAFDRDGRLRWIGADGASSSVLSLPVVSASDPTWSPDGTRLAFTCLLDAGNDDICVANLDGTGFLRLTSHPGKDHQPAWSPDGTRLVFTTTRFGHVGSMALMALDGSDIVEVVLGAEPAWSRDGARLVFVRPLGGLSTVNSDGTGLTNITFRSDRGPAWRP